MGALMIDSDAIGRLGGMLKPESFYDKRNQLLFEAIQQMDLNDRPVDILTVTEFLRSKGTLDEVGGPVYVAQLTSKVVSSVNIEYHANIIAQKKLARDLIRFTSKTQVQAFDETQDIDELMQQAESELFEISGSKMKKDYTQINSIGTLRTLSQLERNPELTSSSRDEALCHCHDLRRAQKDPHKLKGGLNSLRSPLQLERKLKLPGATRETPGDSPLNAR